MKIESKTKTLYKRLRRLHRLIANGGGSAQAQVEVTSALRELTGKWDTGTGLPSYCNGRRGRYIRFADIGEHSKYWRFRNMKNGHGRYALDVTNTCKTIFKKWALEDKKAKEDAAVVDDL